MGKLEVVKLIPWAPHQSILMKYRKWALYPGWLRNFSLKSPNPNHVLNISFELHSLKSTTNRSLTYSVINTWRIVKIIREIVQLFVRRRMDRLLFVVYMRKESLNQNKWLICWIEGLWIDLLLVLWWMIHLPGHMGFSRYFWSSIQSIKLKKDLLQLNFILLIWLAPKE